MPVKPRKKFDIKESSKVEVIEEKGKIIHKKCPNIFDLAGTGAGKANVEELKKMLDQMRNQDA
jgi:bifunctional DNA-binding transcriptional regulator/antitoxin component of YhaV-PrlF toxin-antitoxin module